MKNMSRLTLAVALLGGVGGLATVSPAIAKEKPAKDTRGADLKLTADVRKAAVAAQTALAAKDYATAEPAIAQAEAAAKTDDDRYISAGLRLQLEAGKLTAAPEGSPASNQALLKSPLDALIANPRTPQADRARYNYQRGLIENNAKNSAGALTFFEQARQLGYSDPNLTLQMVKVRMDSGDVAGGSAELAKAVDAQTAAGQKADEALYRYAIAKNLQQKRNADTFVWMKKFLTAYPTAKNWRDMVVLYGLQNGSVATLDKSQRVDLYRLLHSAKALADQYDYEIYGQFVFDLGLPNETKTVLTEGKAAGKIPAASANANDLLKAANQSIGNEGSLAPLEAKAKTAATGKLAANTADAYLGQGNNAKAIELYRMALEKGGVDADAVNTHLAIALADSGDKAGAKTTFALVKAQPRADIASLWTTYLDSAPVA